MARAGAPQHAALISQIKRYHESATRSYRQQDAVCIVASVAV